MPRSAPIFLVLAIVVASCSQFVERQPESTPTPLPTAAEANRPVVQARKGSITETLRGNGRVQALNEATMYFKQSGRLKRLYVELNQKVKKGDKLAELDLGDLGTQIAQARIKLDIAQLGLEQSIKKADQADPNVRKSAANLQQAEATRAQAVAVLQKLQTGTTQADVQAAEAAVTAAQAAVDKARADLASLTQPRNQADVAAAKAAVDKTQSVLQQAQAAYDKIASRADAAARPEAVALQQANADYQAALARYKLTTTGPRPEEVAAAQQAVQSAQAALDGAVARRDQVKAGPQTTDLGSAQAAVTAAAAAVDAARADYEAKVIAAGNSTANFDVQAAQKSVELAGVEVKRLQAQLEDGVLVAPFDGVITSTNGREGDLVAAYNPIAVVSDPSKLIVAIDLNAPDLPKAAIGQSATIATDAFKGQTFQSQVIALPSVAAGVSATNQVPGKPSVASTTVKLSFDPPGPVDLGSLANVTIVTQKHDDAVLVPIQAIKKAGGRTFVQVATGPGKKREVDVQIGIQTDQDVEILKGIKEGTPVITG